MLCVGQVCSCRENTTTTKILHHPYATVISQEAAHCQLCADSNNILYVNVTNRELGHMVQQ